MPTPFWQILSMNITISPYNFDLSSGSSAINAGANLGVNTVGVVDYAGILASTAMGRSI